VHYPDALSEHVVGQPHGTPDSKPKTYCKDLQITFQLLEYLDPGKCLHSSISFLLPRGVTDFEVGVLYNETQYFFAVGLAATLCPDPDIVAHDNRKI
jgi:hypothetical protein